MYQYPDAFPARRKSGIASIIPEGDLAIADAAEPRLCGNLLTG